MEKKTTADTKTDRTAPPADQPNGAGGNGKSGFPFKGGKRRTPIIVGGVVIAVLVAVLVVVGIFWLVDNALYVSTDDASIEGQKANISAKIPGRIKSFAKNEGDHVQAGQPLVLLEDAEARAQVDLATAQLANAKANRDATEADFNRNKSLLANGAITQQAFDKVSQQYETAQAQYGIAEAQLKSANIQFANTTIVSPIDGDVTKPAFQIGDVVQPSQIIFTVNNLKSVWVTANFEETKIGRIEPGAEVDITVDKYPGMSFKGRVTSVDSGVLPPPFQIGEFTKTTRRVPIRIDFTEFPQGVVLQPGLSVEVKVGAK